MFIAHAYDLTLWYNSVFSSSLTQSVTLHACWWCVLVSLLRRPPWCQLFLFYTTTERGDACRVAHDPSLCKSTSFVLETFTALKIFLIVSYSFCLFVCLSFGKAVFNLVQGSTMDGCDFIVWIWVVDFFGAELQTWLLFVSFGGW